VNASARKVPVAGVILLPQREHMNFIAQCQATDECEQSRNHPMFAGTVDTSGHD
jgi:hypothetical protein